jgi:hypothetical protein
MVAQRPAALITGVAAVGVMLGLRQPGAYSGAAFEVRVEGIEGVGPDPANLGVAQESPRTGLIMCRM